MTRGETVTGVAAGTPYGIAGAAVLGALNDATVFEPNGGACMLVEAPGAGWTKGTTEAGCGLASATPGWQHGQGAKCSRSGSPGMSRGSAS